MLIFSYLCVSDISKTLKHANHNLQCFVCFAQLTVFFFFLVFQLTYLYIKLHFLSITETKSVMALKCT